MVLYNSNRTKEQICFFILCINSVCILYSQNMHHDPDCVSYSFLLSPQVSQFPISSGLHVESRSVSLLGMIHPCSVL